MLLEDGSVLVWAGRDITLWNPQSGSLTAAPSTLASIAGAGYVTSAAGAPAILGGTASQAQATGITDSHIFNVASRAWTAGPPMNLARWRPTATVLADGRVLVTGGADGCPICYVSNPELFDPVTQSWALLGAAGSPASTYPFMFVLPGGDVIHAGNPEFATATETFDPAAGTWSGVDGRVLDGGSAVMFGRGQIMKSGSAASSGSSGPAARTTYVLDMSAASPAWRSTASMAYQRAYHNLTVLPDGTVVASGGSTLKDGVDPSKAVLPAELWTPSSATWRTMASMSVARPSQSASLLLPDGRLLVTGPPSDGSSAAAAEVYSPPYLFKGTRPGITSAPSDLTYGVPVFVGTDDPNIAAVSLIGLGAVGHSFDQGQRFLPLSFSTEPGGITVSPPLDGSLAPPGTYLLFVLNQAGVPSVGRFVTISGFASTSPATAGGLLVSADVVAAATVPGLVIDVVASGDQGSATRNTVTSSAFSTTAADELLLAFVSADHSSGAATTVTNMTGAGLVWQLVMRTNAQRGTAEIWRAMAPQALTNVSVTTTLSQNAASSMTIAGITGADTAGTNGSGAIGATRSANAASGAPTTTLTTTRDNSWVFGVGNDWDNAIARTVGSNQTMMHQYLAPVGDTYWVQRLSNPTPTSGTSVTLNDTAPTADRYNLSVVEILPALATSTDTTAPTIALTAPATGATVSGTAVTVSANASDTVGVVGVQFTLDGANLGAEDTASPYSIPWNTTLATDGSHTLTAVARDAAGNTATATSVTVTVSNGVSAALSIDVTAFGDRSPAASTIATSTFSTTAANELLLAFVATDSISGSMTVTGMTGGSLTWQLAARTNTQLGTAEVWRAFAPSALSNVTVTASLAQSVSASITVVSFKNADGSGSSGSGAIGATRSASANPGAPSVTLTTTRAGSWVFGVSNDWDNAIARTVGSGQTMVHQFLSAVGDTYWVQRRTTPTAAAGTNVTINDTAPTGDRYNLTLVEVLPAMATPDPTPPTVSMTAPANGATVSGTTVTVAATASDNIGVAGVQFELDGANLGAEVTASPYSVGWDSTTASNGSHMLEAVARDAAGNTTTALSVTVTVSNPPAISAVKATSINTTSALILWTTSTASNSQVNYGLTSAYGQATVPDPTLVSLHTQTVAGLSPSTLYHFQVVSTDTSGLTAASSDFTFTTTSGQPTFALSGSVSASGAGATVSLTGASSATALADGSGMYAFVGLSTGTYVVTPALSGFSFSPASRTVNVNGSDVSSVNFVATAESAYSISGTISPAASGGAGATVTLSGAADVATTADAAGAYSFAGLQPGSYTVTPSGAGATFSPTSQAVVITAATVGGVNFTATSTGNVIFFDDFNGTSLSSEWTVIARHGEYLQAENECNTADAVSVSGGFLTITTTAQATTCGDFNVDGSVRHAPQTWPYRTGDVQWRTRNFTYGTVEVRAKFPAKQTVLWPAIWLLGANCQNTNPFTADQGYLTCPDFSPSYAEIDITECDLNNWCQLALWTGGSFPTCGYAVDTNFHTFTLTWKANLVSVSVDGQPTGCSFTDHIPSVPQFLILQTQTGGNGGNPNNALLPAQFVIDYVKVTQP